MTFQTIPYPTNTVIIVICVTIVTQEQRGGLGYTPEMRLWISKRYASKTRLPPKTMTNKPDTRTNSYMLSGVNHF